VVAEQSADPLPALHLSGHSRRPTTRRRMDQLGPPPVPPAVPSGWLGIRGVWPCFNLPQRAQFVISPEVSASLCQSCRPTKHRRRRSERTEEAYPPPPPTRQRLDVIGATSAAVVAFADMSEVAP
jgi:hypothetical protein